MTDKICEHKDIQVEDSWLTNPEKLRDTGTYCEILCNTCGEMGEIVLDGVADEPDQEIEDRNLYSEIEWGVVKKCEHEDIIEVDTDIREGYVFASLECVDCKKIATQVELISNLPIKLGYYVRLGEEDLDWHNDN